MLIVGAKGFAKEVLEIIFQNKIKENIALFDDINPDILGKMYGRFTVLKNEAEVRTFFNENGPQFTIGIGNPHLREKMYNKFTNWGGILNSVISKKTDIGNFGVHINDGCNILSGVKISNEVQIGMGVIVYYNCVITHDVAIGDFVELSPGVILLGGCKIGSMSHIGAGAIIFPNVIIGENVKVGAGAVVRENLPDNVVAVGVPAKIVK